MAKKQQLSDITLMDDKTNEHSPVAEKDAKLAGGGVSDVSPDSMTRNKEMKKKSAGISPNSPTTYLSENTKSLLLKIKGSNMIRGKRISENDIILKGLTYLIEKEYPEIVIQ